MTKGRHAAIEQAEHNAGRRARIVIEQGPENGAGIDGGEAAFLPRGPHDFPGAALGAGLGFDIGIDVAALEVGPVVGGKGPGAGLVMAIGDGGHG
jgi:hypothetical protein